MGYVAIKGGSEAVLNAEQLLEFFRLRGESEPLQVRQIQDQLRLAVDRAMNEGGLYAPELAALALKQSEGDALEASFLLRAYRSTLPRLAYTMTADGAKMRVLRRISSTFKDIPGGQLLGPTRDYQLKLLNTLLHHESSQSIREYLARFEGTSSTELSPTDALGMYPKVVDNMRQQGIVAQPAKAEEGEPYDVTRKALSFPAPRSARLQVMSRGEVGSLLTFAYSSVRGYGDAHPTLGELRVGYLPVEVAHPITGEAVEIGEILVTECEMVSRVSESDDSQENLPQFGLGYGFTFGHSEVKAISMSIVDRVLTVAEELQGHGESGPAANAEFVLQHIDGIESSGFTAHFKLPHYVTFQADMSVMERSRDYEAEKIAANAELQRQYVVAENGQPQTVATTKAKPFAIADEDEED